MIVVGPYRIKALGNGQKTLVDIGMTEAGFTTTDQTLGNPLTADIHGDTWFDGFDTGVRPYVEFAAMEYSLANMKLVLPQGQGGDVQVGRLWSASCIRIVAEPILGKGLPTFVFWRCKCQEPVPVIFSGTAPSKIPMKFLLLPDYSKQSGEVFYSVTLAR